MSAARKDSLRQDMKHSFYENGLEKFRLTLVAVREDSGVTFHDRRNDETNTVMVDVMTRFRTDLETSSE